MNDQLKHVGVMGMRWGVRSQRSMSTESGGKGYRSAHQKNLDAKKISKAENGWKAVKDTKLSAYQTEQKKAKRMAIILTLVSGAMLFAPQIGKGLALAGNVGMFGVVVGKMKISGLMGNRKFNKYGGFDPKRVVNSKMWDAPLKIIPTLLLGKGG